MSDLAERAASPDQDLDAAIEQARAALSAVLRTPEPSGGPRQVAQARALLASLLISGSPGRRRGWISTIPPRFPRSAPTVTRPSRSLPRCSTSYRPAARRGGTWR